jgi:predicted permease
MTEFLYILKSISLPIVILIAIGFGFQKIFKTDSRGFTKLLLYFLTPVMLFVKMYKIEITTGFFASVVPYILIINITMILLGIVLARVMRQPKSKEKAMVNSLVLYNSGNYGIPLIELAFGGNALTMVSQLFVVIAQNITSSTVGVYQASFGSGSRRDALKNIVKMPALYTLVLIAIVNFTGFTVPEPIMIPLDFIADGFIAMALITLGMQLAQISIKFNPKLVLITSAVRLLLAPVLGFGLVLLFGLKGILAQALVVGVATPTAVNSTLLADEFGNEREFAAQMVIMTTVFCTFTLPLVIYLAKTFVP